MTTKTRKTSINNGRKQAFTSQLKGLKLHGWLVAWNTPEGGTTYSTVVNALKSVGLDENLAKERLPENAFTRASRKLEEEGVIDPLPHTTLPGSIDFQFTEKALDSTGDEWKYQKKVTLSLDKNTGKVTCSDSKLRELAQTEIDKHIQHRTGNDISAIVNRLFSQHTELIRWRQQGGAYIVLTGDVAYADQIEAFLEKIGGSLNRLPIPAGTQTGDRDVQKTVTAHMERLVQEHQEAANNFGIDTRSDTLQRAADKINETRVKVEAYAHYLSEKRQELLDSLDEQNKKLTERIEQLTNRKTEKKSSNFSIGSVTEEDGEICIHIRSKR